MRIARFKTYLVGVLAKGPVAAEWTPDDQAVSVELAFATGARVFVKLVRTAADGGDRPDAAERIVEGDEAPAVLAVGAPQPDGDGRLQVRDIELYLRELILAGGSREIRAVRSFSAGEASGAHPYGLAVDFHSGATVFVLFVHTVPSGRQPGHTDYAPLVAI